MHTFEEQIIWQFQKLFFENLRIRALPPDHCIFWKKHPRKKCQKVDPHYFSILEKHSKGLKTAISWQNIIYFLEWKLQFWGTWGVFEK